MAVLGLGCCRKSLCLYSSIGGPAKLREGSILSSEDGTNADCYRKVLSAFFFFFPPEDAVFVPPLYSNIFFSLKWCC